MKKIKIIVLAISVFSWISTASAEFDMITFLMETKVKMEKLTLLVQKQEEVIAELRSQCAAKQSSADLEKYSKIIEAARVIADELKSK